MYLFPKFGKLRFRDINAIDFEKRASFEVNRSQHKEIAMKIIRKWKEEESEL